MLSSHSCFHRLLSVAMLLFFAAPFTHAGTILEHTFQSQALGREYHYTVYLPDGYKTSRLRYPVLYLLHGAHGNQYSWIDYGGIKETTDALIAEGAIPPTLVVMPGHTAGWWVDGAKEKGETAFMQELLPDVAKNFRIIKARAGCAVAGLSAGGYGTVRFILKYPERFAAAAALSPAIYESEPPEISSARRHHPFFGPDGTYNKGQWQALNYPLLINAYFAQPIRVPLYINSGDHDQYNIAYEAAVLFRKLRTKQPESVELRIVDGDHSWMVWASTIGDAMKYIYRFVSKPVAD